MKKFVALWALVIALILIAPRLFDDGKPDRTGGGEKPDYTANISLASGQGGSDNGDVLVNPQDIYITEDKYNYDKRVYEDEIKMLVVWDNRDKQSTVIYGSNCVIEVQKDGQWIRYTTGARLSGFKDEIKGEDIDNVQYLLTDFFDRNPEEKNLYRATFTCTVRDSAGKEEQCSVWAEFTISNVNIPS